MTYTAGADVEPVDPDPALCLYRIAQEALGNVAKHARATHVEVALTRTPEGLQLTIADDGHGFDLAGTRARPGGLGLVSIDERVRLLRGGVSIDTHPRGGTRMRILLSVAPRLASTVCRVADRRRTAIRRRIERRYDFPWGVGMLQADAV